MPKPEHKIAIVIFLDIKPSSTNLKKTNLKKKFHLAHSATLIVRKNFI